MSKQKIKSCLVISIILFLINIACNTYANSKMNDKPNILFISSYHRNFISFEDQVKGVKDAFDNNVNLRIEYMDTKGYYDIEGEKKFYTLIEDSMKIYDKFDAIIVADDEALEFSLKYRDDLFKNIPISFLGAQKSKNLTEAMNYELVSGVREMESIEGTLNLIRKFHKNIKNIIFINDFGESFYEEVTSKNLDFTYDSIVTSNYSIDEFREKIADIPKNSAIILLYPHYFKNNEWLGYLDVGEILRNDTVGIPIYSVLSYNIGSGSIGGKVIDHYNQGKKAGEIAISLINGEEPKNMYIDDDSANQYIFDYNLLEEFNISKNKLPTNSIILNDPLDIFIQYKEYFLVLVIILLTLILWIALLIRNIYYKDIYEKNILNAMYEAEEATKLKMHFIYNISHEIKTPINVILSAVQLIESNSKNEDNLNKLDIIRNNCFRLTRLLNNIIDIKKTDLCDLKLNFKNINIVNLVEDLVLSIIPYANNKNLDVIFDTNKEEIIMKVDSEKIERVILNLISNAIKFSKENGVIKVNLESEEKLLKIIIEDEGIGIAEENIDKIFGRFTQIDNTFTRSNEGSGIGLSIVKSFIELHGGHISVKSELDKGTKFIIKLPIIEEDERDIYNIEKKSLNENTKIEFSDIYV